MVEGSQNKVDGEAGMAASASTSPLGCRLRYCRLSTTCTAGWREGSAIKGCHNQNVRQWILLRDDQIPKSWPMLLTHFSQIKKNNKTFNF